MAKQILFVAPSSEWGKEFSVVMHLLTVWGEYMVNVE